MLILNMFDRELVNLLQGDAANRAWNGLTLLKLVRDQYNKFEMSFGAVAGESVRPNTYRIYPRTVPFQLFFPETITLAETEPATDIPSCRLIRMHRVIYLMLHLSGAGEYFDEVNDDASEWST